VVSNAGFADRTPLALLSDAAMNASVEAIQGAFFRLARAAIPYLRTADQPRIIAVSSFVAHSFRTDIATFPASAAAKAALQALVRALAIELGSSGVTVNAVVPGFIRKDEGAHRAIDPAALASQTQRIPLGRGGVFGVTGSELHHRPKFARRWRVGHLIVASDARAWSAV
jgi:3-oxoacyl-[acyl-carrier protein] reductase